MAQRTSPSRLIELSENGLFVQSIPDLSPSFFEYASDSDDQSSKSKSLSSTSTKKSKRGRSQTRKSAKPSPNKQKKRLSNGRTNSFNNNTSNREHDLKGSEVNWRSTFGDEPSDEDEDDNENAASESEEWYNGEDEEFHRPIPGEWVLIPPSKTPEEEALAAEIEDERNTFQPFTQDPDEMFQILPRVPEATVQELREVEEEVRRYRWAVGTRELMEIGFAGVGMFLGLSGRILRDLERFF